jgi:hypothetical protein
MEQSLRAQNLWWLQSCPGLAEGNRGSIIICFAKQSEIHIRSELGAANRGDRASGRRARRRQLIKPSELVVAFILSQGSILDDHLVHQ